MPCLSSSADSVLNESTRVSNAESQLALPLTMTTVFGASVISSPKGSAVWTGAAAGGGAAGVSAAAGGAAEGLGAGVADAAGAGVADASGAGVAEAAGAGVAGALAAGGAADGGDCASALPRPDQIAAAGISASRASRKEQGKFIRYSPWRYR